MLRLKIGDIIRIKKTENITLISAISGMKGRVLGISKENVDNIEVYHIALDNGSHYYNIDSRYLILYNPSRRDGI